MTATIKLTHLTQPGSDAMLTKAAHYDITVEINGAQYQTLLELDLWDRVQAGYAPVATNEFGELIVHDHDMTDITQYFIADDGFYDVWRLNLEAGKFRQLTSDGLEIE